MIPSCMIILATTLGIIQNCTSLFVPEICSALSVSRTKAQLLFTFFSIGSVIASLLSTVVYEKYKPGKVMKVAVLFLAPLYYLNGIATSIIQHYIIAFLVGFIQTYITMLPITLIVSNWFVSNKGKIIGITLMGSSLGGAIFNKVAGKMIVNLGYQATYRVLAIIMLVCTIPITYFVIRDNPYEMGLEPYGNNTKQETVVVKKKIKDYALSDLKKQPLFWMFMCSLTLSSIAGINANTTVSPHLVSLGYGTEKAASVVSIVMLSMTAGKYILGAIFDKLGTKKGLIFSQLFLCLTFVSLILARNSIFIVLVIIGVGLGGVLVTVGYPLIVESTFGRKDYAAIFGLVNAFQQAGNMLASVVTGLSFDKYGSYNPAFVLLIIVTVISTIIILLTNKKYQNV